MTLDLALAVNDVAVAPSILGALAKSILVEPAGAGGGQATTTEKE